MNILAPFDTVDEVKLLITKGANELYCGVNNAWWRKRKIFSNARHMFYGNLNSFTELKESLIITKKHGIPIFLCANDYLPNGAFQHLLSDIKLAIELGVDGIIVADVALIPFIKEINSDCKIILSCLNPCFSLEGISFYKELGVHRVILPLNQLTLTEIEEISLFARKLSVEIEVFINNIACKNVPGNCLFSNFKMFNYHCQYGLGMVMTCLRNMSKLIPSHTRNKLGKTLYASRLHPKSCRQDFCIKVFNKSNGKFTESNRIDKYSAEKNFAYTYCGLCSIYFLEQYKVTSGKIVGRGYATQRKVKDVIFANKFLGQIESRDISESNFAEKGMELYRELYGRDCSIKRCHFEEVSYQRRVTQCSRV